MILLKARFLKKNIWRDYLSLNPGRKIELSNLTPHTFEWLRRKSGNEFQNRPRALFWPVVGVSKRHRSVLYK